MSPTRDIVLVKLAHEIAVDHLDAETILNLYSITQEEWEVIQKTPRFQRLLEQEITNWQSASNTTERTRLKAGAIMENWLPEANSRLHDPKETLNGKVELAKLISRISGLDKTEALIGGGSSGFSVTINIGNGEAPLTFEKQLPERVIEHEA